MKKKKARLASAAVMLAQSKSIKDQVRGWVDILNIQANIAHSKTSLKHKHYNNISVLP